MAKFSSKKQMLRSLLDEISLMHRGTEFVWAFYSEIPLYEELGYSLTCDEKREEYERLERGGK